MREPEGRRLQRLLGEGSLTKSVIVGPGSEDASLGTADGPRAFITGLAGTTLDDAEAALLAETQPCGLIIFSRNYLDDSQLGNLIDAASAAVGRGDLLVLVDQEGGRVQRLRGGGWPDLPSAAQFGALYRRDAQAALGAVKACMQGLGRRLRAVGINTNCAPCLDVSFPGADDVIGDRAFSDEPELVSVLGRAAAEGLLAAGVVPVIKHIPGHGRALVDSHQALPVVRVPREELRAWDFAPFAALSGMPAAMTAHVTFEAFDSSWPASISPVVTLDVIRGEIGFDGFLMSDDISMGALAGSVGDRARLVLAAGSDVVLHCNGDIAEIREVAARCPSLSGASLTRYKRCLDIVSQAGKPVPEAAFRSALALVSDEVGIGESNG